MMIVRKTYDIFVSRTTFYKNSDKIGLDAVKCTVYLFINALSFLYVVHSFEFNELGRHSVRTLV